MVKKSPKQESAKRTKTWASDPTESKVGRRASVRSLAQGQPTTPNSARIAFTTAAGARAGGPPLREVRIVSDEVTWQVAGVEAECARREQAPDVHAVHPLRR